MTDTEQIIFKMTEGFGVIHERLNVIVDQTTQRRMDCEGRFAQIEKEVAVKNAVNGVNDKVKKGKVAFQSYLVRGSLMIIIGGILLIIWKIFIGHIDLIVKG